MKGRSLLFLAPGDVRKARVEPISWMRTCESFAARGLAVELQTLRMAYPDGVEMSEIWSHFGVAPEFRVRAFPTPMKRDASSSQFRLWATLAAARTVPRSLAAAVRSPQRPVVYSRSPIMLAPYAALAAATKKRRPLLVHETHTMPPVNAHAVVGRADLIVTNSTALAEEVREVLALAPRQVLAAPLPPYAHVQDTAKADARSALGLPADAPLGCYTGKMLDDEWPFLFEVAREARRRRPGFRLLLVGGNPDVVERMHARRDAEGLTDTVDPVGFVDPEQVALYQAAADVLVLHMADSSPKLAYCTPAKAYDYQAAGRPIVSRDLPLFGEVFGADGERALRVAESTPAAFATQIERALTLPDGGAAMTERARAAMAGRTWQSRTDLILQAVEERT